MLMLMMMPTRCPLLCCRILFRSTDTCCNVRYTKQTRIPTSVAEHHGGEQTPYHHHNRRAQYSTPSCHVGGCSVSFEAQSTSLLTRDPGYNSLQDRSPTMSSTFLLAVRNQQVKVVTMSHLCRKDIFCSLRACLFNDSFFLLPCRRSSSSRALVKSRAA